MSDRDLHRGEVQLSSSRLPVIMRCCTNHHHGRRLLDPLRRCVRRCRGADRPRVLDLRTRSSSSTACARTFPLMRKQRWRHHDVSLWERSAVPWRDVHHAAPDRRARDSRRLRAEGLRVRAHPGVSRVVLLDLHRRPASDVVKGARAGVRAAEEWRFATAHSGQRPRGRRRRRRRYPALVESEDGSPLSRRPSSST